MRADERGAPARLLVLVALCLMVALGALTSCSKDPAGPATSAPGGEAVTLKVGQLRSNLKPLLEAAGQLHAVPYKVDWSSFDVGPDAIAAQDAGAVDVAYMADTPPIFAQAAGIDVKVVGLTRAPAGARNVAVVVSAGSAIQSVTDLAGKKVAVVPGTVTQYLLIQALDHAGSTLNDITEVNLQGPEAMTALRDGDVAATVLVDPLLASALLTANARTLVDGTGLLSGSNALVATDQALRDPRRAQAIGDLLGRLRAALRWTSAHPDDWAAVYGATNHLPRQVARQAVDRSATELVPIDAAAIAAQQHQADAFAAVGLLDHKLDVEDEFDDRYNARLFLAAQ